MRPPRGKRRTRAHVIADLSVCFVEWQALRCGYTIERVRDDYGIDLELKTYNKAGEREPGDILMQVKATDGLSLRPGQNTFSFRIERADLRLWLAEKSPVILIVFDAKKTRAYWCYIQQYFQAIKGFDIDATGNTITINVSLANRLNSRSMRQFSRFRDRISDQLEGLQHE